MFTEYARHPTPPFSEGPVPRPLGPNTAVPGLRSLKPSAGTWWFAPGGGLEPGETEEAAAIREVFEETGQRVSDLGSKVATTHSVFSFMNHSIHQETVYFTEAIAAAARSSV